MPSYRDRGAVALIDDRKSARQQLCDFLIDEGFRVQCYASVETFLVVVPPDNLKCILLSVGKPMPEDFAAVANIRGAILKLQSC